MEGSRVRAFAGYEPGPGAEEGWGEVREGSDVVGENLGDSDPVVEGKAERDGLVIGEVAHEKRAFEGDGGKDGPRGCGGGG